MLDGVLVRGTTPTHSFPIPDSISLTDIKDFTITYRQKNKNVLIKTKYDASIQSKIIKIELSQIDTLMFDPKIKYVFAQVKVNVKGKIMVLDTHKYRLEEAFDTNQM